MFSQHAKIQDRTLKQSAFSDAEHLKDLCPKMLNLARKRLFMVYQSEESFKMEEKR